MLSLYPNPKENKMCILKYLIVFVVSATYVNRAASEYFTSVSGMDVLLEAEGHLLHLVGDYMARTDQTVHKKLLRTLSHIRREYHEAKSDPLAYLSNPISAFKLIKRFLFEWADITEYMKDYTDVSAYLNTKMETSFEPPTKDDLLGLALGLARLQETYVLNVTDLAGGKILGTKYGSAMSASDCMELGMILYKANEYTRSIPWLIEAKTKLAKSTPLPLKPIMGILETLSYIYIHLRNPKMVIPLITEMLSVDTFFRGTPETEIFSKEPTREKISAMTCRGERRQTPSELRPLRCRYTTNGVLHRLIGPFQMEQLNLDPLIEYYYQTITDKEIDYLVEKAELNITRSKVSQGKFSGDRTSKTKWLEHKDLKYLDKLFCRLKDITGLTSAGPLQVVNYGSGGHQTSHLDFGNKPELWCQRMATALFYLSDVELGGATAFTHYKLAVPPVKGGMILWYNLHDSLEPDYSTLHAACPVLKGSKWIAAQWYPAFGHELIKPCSAEKQDNKSEKYTLAYMHEHYNLGWKI